MEEVNISKESSILTIEKAVSLKGICALWIMLGHLGRETALKLLWIPWKGNLLIVGVFFLISGYGVMHNLLRKGRGYLTHFLQKRLISILVPAYLVYLFGGFWQFFFVNDKIQIKDMINYIFFSEMWAKTNWFVWEIICFYILFFLLFKFWDIKSGYYLLFVSCILFEILSAVFLQGNQAWYTSTMALPFAVGYAIHEEKVNKWIKSAAALKIFINVIIIIGSYIISTKMPENYLISNSILKNIGSISMCIIVLILADKLCFVSRITLWLGRISMEIFLLHLMLMPIIRSLTDNDLIYVILVVTLTIVLAIPFSKFNKSVKNFCK